MKPSLLQRHLLQNSTFQEKPIEFFNKKARELKDNKKSLVTYTGSNIKAVEASYLVSLQIAKTGKPHTIGETLILPSAKIMI